MITQIVARNIHFREHNSFAKNKIQQENPTSPPHKLLFPILNPGFYYFLRMASPDFLKNSYHE